MDRPTDPRRPQRPGRVAAFLLVSLVALFGAGALAVDAAWLWSARQELQVSADAAALAALRSLADDDLLLGDPAAAQPLLADGRAQARLYARLNPVQGRPLALDANPANAPTGDVVFGVLDTPRSRTFVAAERVDDPSNAFLARI